MKPSFFSKHTLLGGEIVESISASNEQFDGKKNFKEKIGDWYFKNRPSRECFEELLKILIEENLDVPLSANSFIKHKRDKSLQDKRTNK